jgi:hypothetical protein
MRRRNDRRAVGGRRSRGGTTVDVDEQQAPQPRTAGDWLEYAPDQWVRGSAVVAVEAITGATAAAEGGTAFLSSVTLIASEASGREVRRRSIYPVGVLVAALASPAVEGTHPPPAPADRLRPGQRAPGR